MATAKETAAMKEEISNLKQRERVYEDWNKQLHEVCKKEAARRKVAEEDLERLAAALKAGHEVRM
jgi:hypothetical protein